MNNKKQFQYSNRMFPVYRLAFVKLNKYQLGYFVPPKRPTEKKMTAISTSLNCYWAFLHFLLSVNTIFLSFFYSSIVIDI